jgi:hypothetical protein
MGSRASCAGWRSTFKRQWLGRPERSARKRHSSISTESEHAWIDPGLNYARINNPRFHDAGFSNARVDDTGFHNAWFDNAQHDEPERS